MAKYAQLYMKTYDLTNSSSNCSVSNENILGTEQLIKDIQSALDSCESITISRGKFLKNCPLCGGSANLSSHRTGCTGRTTIMCQNCKLEISSNFDGGEKYKVENEIKLMNRWNHRVE